MFVSPWFSQLNRTRHVDTLQTDKTAQVAIIGGGIAGITTAYYTLRNTQHTVVLIEATKVAHGATGHNAGQIVSYFEKPFSDLVAQFGMQQAADAQHAVHSAWELLAHIQQEAQLRTPLRTFTGYAGFSSEEQVRGIIDNLALQRAAGLTYEHLFLADDAYPAQAETSFCTRVSREHLQLLLETKDTCYIAALASRKGCMNSALFCEELAGYLLATYPERFTLYEHSPVTTIDLASGARIHSNNHSIHAHHAVLCTNGFDKITIQSTTGIDEKFHSAIKGTVGYMCGYIERTEKPPVAISYLKHASADENDPYFYLTRRDYAHTEKLVCVGGPETDLPPGEEYHPNTPYIPGAEKEIDAFLQESYVRDTEPFYAYRWHGLMGYTRNGVRLVGSEPTNHALLYNLGCNGIGILPSIYGSWRISEILAGKTVAPSIFDPQ